MGIWKYVSPPRANRNNSLHGTTETLKNLILDLNIGNTNLLNAIENCCKDDPAERCSSLGLLESLALARPKSLLHAAIEKDWLDDMAILDIELIERLLESGAQVNEKGEFGETALHLVSWGGNFDEAMLAPVTELLRKNGADAEAGDRKNLTPSDWEACSLRGLQKQLRTGFQESLPGHLYFRKDAVTSTSWQIYMPLFLAAASGNERLLRIIVRDVNCFTPTMMRVLSVLAAPYGHANCLKFLREESMERQWTKLRHLSNTIMGTVDFANFADVVRKVTTKLLLDAVQADVDPKLDTYKETPLLWAVEDRDMIMVALLLTLLLDEDKAELDWIHARGVVGVIGIVKSENNESGERGENKKEGGRRKRGRRRRRRRRGRRRKRRL